MALTIIGRAHHAGGGRRLPPGRRARAPPPPRAVGGSAAAATPPPRPAVQYGTVQYGGTSFAQGRRPRAPTLNY
eukprot:5985587-Pyramimonas_sp.AAC.1